MTTSAMLHVRVSEDIKAQATQTLAAMGLSVSEAVRVFLTRVVADQQLPFALKVPNADSQAAMVQSDAIVAAAAGRYSNAQDMFDALDHKKAR